MRRCLRALVMVRVYGYDAFYLNKVSSRAWLLPTFKYFSEKACPIAEKFIF